MAYTLGQAAQASGKSRSTIKRALENGQIVGEKGDSGKWQIEPAELRRVYPIEEQGTVSDSDNSKKSVSDSRELQLQLEAAKQQIADKDKTINDLRSRLDRSEEERRKKDHQLTAMLTEQEEKPKNPFQRWLGGLW